MQLNKIPNHFLKQLSIIATHKSTQEVTRIKCSIKNGITELTVLNGNLMGCAYIKSNLDSKHNLECYFTVYGKPPSTGFSNIDSEKNSCIFTDTNVKQKIIYAEYHDKRVAHLKRYEENIEKFNATWWKTLTQINNSKKLSIKTDNLRFLGTVFGNQPVILTRREIDKTIVMGITAAYPDGEFSLIEMKAIEDSQAGQS